MVQPEFEALDQAYSFVQLSDHGPVIAGLRCELVESSNVRKTLGSSDPESACPGECQVWPAFSPIDALTLVAQSWYFEHFFGQFIHCSCTSLLPSSKSPLASDTARLKAL